MKRLRIEPRKIADLAALAMAAAVVGGCAGAGSIERFYALNDGGVVQSTTTSTTGLANQGPALPGIVISAVTVPELVDRPQIVTRDADNRVNVSEQNLWAEPVRAAIGRTLATRLARAMVAAGRPAQVAAYPQSSIQNPYLRVTIDVVRFDAVPNGEAVIDALWSVRRSSDGAVRTGHTVASSPISGISYDAIVRGWNEALREVDRDIAAMVVQTTDSAPPVEPAR
ncbi:MAG: PqiC family protein [Burkholderiaceae bacterium]